MTYRSFAALRSSAPSTLAYLTSSGTIDPHAAGLLSEAVRSGRRILVTGPTSSGRSTVAHCILSVLPLATPIVVHTADGIPALHRRTTVQVQDSVRGAVTLLEDLEVPDASALLPRSGPLVATIAARSTSGALARASEALGLSSEDTVSTFDLVVLCGIRRSGATTRRVVLALDEVSGVEGERFQVFRLAGQEGVEAEEKLSPEDILPEVLARTLSLLALAERQDLRLDVRRFLEGMAEDGGETGAVAALLASRLGPSGCLTDALLEFPYLQSGSPRTLLRIMREISEQGVIVSSSQSTSIREALVAELHSLGAQPRHRLQESPAI